MADPLDAGKAIRVAFDSVKAVTRTSRAYNPNETLAWYNVNDDNQAQQIRNTIHNDKSFGLPKYGYTIDSNLLLGLGAGMKMIDLVNILVGNASQVED